jgi:hypothetical protein
VLQDSRFLFEATKIKSKPIFSASKFLQVTRIIIKPAQLSAHQSKFWLAFCAREPTHAEIND